MHRPDKNKQPKHCINKIMQLDALDDLKDDHEIVFNLSSKR